MPKADSDLSRRFPATGLPWLLAFAALVVYALTLNHWIAAESLRTISLLQGVSGQIEYTSPVFYVVTYPLRWLPPATIPVAANALTALFAALVVAQLARSVTLLAHDRNSIERQRNPHRHGLLATPLAWIPPLVAVLLCGFQLTFWEHSVAATGEMFDLLLFALMVRCILEFRIQKKDGWLVLCAALNGLAVANNWAMVGYLPLFALIIFWFKGGFHIFTADFLSQVMRGKLENFSLAFFWRCVPWWLAGFAFFLLLPIISSHSAAAPLPFWLCLKVEIRVYLLKLQLLPFFGIVLLSLTSLLPMIFIGIRWGRLVQHDTPVVTVLISASMFHFINLLFLLTGIWVMLDSPLSARHLQSYFPCLPLYFLTTIVVSYCAGYFLLIWRSRSDRPRRNVPFYRNRQTLAFLGLAGVTAVAVTMLVCKNLPVILRKQDSEVLNGYFAELERELPAQGAIVLSYEPAPLLLLEESLIRHHHQTNYVLACTSLIGNHPEYLDFLNRKYPAFKLRSYLAHPADSLTNGAALLNWMRNLSKKQGIYSFHPIAGFLAESFQYEPQRLLCHLTPAPTNLAPVMTMSTAEYQRAKVFWADFQKQTFTNVLNRIKLPTGRFMPAEPDSSTFLVAGYYSLDLNTWGVQLQRHGELDAAGQAFTAAKKINSLNYAADLNSQCNDKLRIYDPISMDPATELAQKVDNIVNWDLLIRLDGPLDEPNACMRLGILFSAAQMWRQAVEQFLRVRELAPDYTDAALRLGDAYLKTGMNSNALEQANAVLELDSHSHSALLLKGLAEIALKDYSAAVPTLTELINADPQNVNAHITRGYANLQLNRFSAADVDYAIALNSDPDSFPAYYGLASLAYKRQQLYGVVKYGQLYLDHAPTNAPERTEIESWIAEAQKKK